MRRNGAPEKLVARQGGVKAVRLQTASRRERDFLGKGRTTEYMSFCRLRQNE